MTSPRRPLLPGIVAALVLAVALIAGLGVGRLVTSGFAASLGLQAAGLATFTGPAPGDLGPPRLVALEMFDDDANGRVDRVTATFHKALATPYDAGTTGWTLDQAPSGATLASVSIAGATATLVLTEGTGPQATDVGAFTVALAATEGGIRDAEGRLASFAATAPTDRAAPVPVGVATTVAGASAGQMEAGDALTFTFSEPVSVPATTTIVLADAPGGANRDDSIDIAGITAGPVFTGGTTYVTKNEATATATATVALSADGRSFTVTVDTCACADAKPGSGAFTYQPPPEFTDAAGNAATGSFTTATTFRLF